ncbi:hypothetical protein EJB05_32129, partial [Eragrostis curvula]
MNAVISAVASDFISRFISFLIDRSQQAHQVITNDDDNNKIVPRLQRLLLRACTVVEEAEGRRLTNRGMLLQLKQLKEAMYRGYYVLDTFGADQPCRPKRGFEVISQQCKLQSHMDNLEATLEGMKEFLLVLMHCPPVVRQPYDSYLFMENSMYGRRMEKECIISFLLRPCSYLDVLPVVGPCYVGKRTLVEHVCREEIVKRKFSNILHFRSNDLQNPVIEDAMDQLIVVELVQDTDEVAWDKIHNSLRHRAGKAILISVKDRVSRLGTVQAIRLTRLHQEEYWYFFRVLAFGRADPFDHHPDLASIGKEIAAELDGYLMLTIVVTRVLRANMNVQFWRRALRYIRRSNQMRLLVFGEDQRDISKRRFCPYFTAFAIYEVEEGSMMQGDMTNAVMAEDVLDGKLLTCLQHIVLGEKDCSKEKVLVLHFCHDSININGAYVAPTAACLNIVQAEEVDMICICRNIAPADEVLISVMKFLQLARDCNKPLPAGTKCGNPSAALHSPCRSSSAPPVALHLQRTAVADLLTTPAGVAPLLPQPRLTSNGPSDDV